MTRPGPVIVAPAHAWSEAAANIVADLVRRAARARGRCALALAGGSTPRSVYERLAGRTDVPWRAVEIFFGDERCVPPDDEASNAGMAAAALGDVVPAGRRHRMHGEDADREAAAAAYARLLPPRLDVLLLGIGTDGHVASLFPGGAALEERQRLVVPAESPTPPRHRLTVTPPVLAAAREIVVLATGSAKAAPVAAARATEGTVATLPARLARRGTWVLDEAAAAGLEPESAGGRA